MEAVKVGLELAGRRLTIETGRLAKQANGAAVVQYGDTIILATAVLGEAQEGMDFLPLTVDFEARTYAAGKIPMTFYRREGKPSDRSILVARLTDRPLRPLFPEGMRNEVQIIITPLSSDPENSPDVLSPIGASAALSVSDIPFQGPVACVRVGLIEGELALNPTYSQMEHSDLDLVVAGTKEALLMVEAGANEVPEETLLRALEFAHDAIRQIAALQEELVARAGREKAAVELARPEEELLGRVGELAAGPIGELLGRPEKQARHRALEALREEILAQLAEAYPEREGEIQSAFEKVLKQVVRRMTLEEGRRVDGRRMEEVRPITCEVGLLPRVHGSALFTRGETQVLSVTTLGTVGDEKTIDWLTEDFTSRYMHHYNFLPFCVGEVRPLRGPGRREIGHGALAERALVPVLPEEEEFPYTIRVVSEILESNGSSSMASVCGSSLSLMDAGVPIRSAVAGVAMGLLKENDQYRILTDIEGMEDAYGDMDFKVAGTEKGITALQMDIKIAGLEMDLLAEALEWARRARLFIRDKMLTALPAPRPELSPYAPRITIITIDPDKIGTVIGPGGKTINRITEETGTQIDIEDDGRVYIAAPNEEAGQRARKMIEDLVRDVVVGEEYVGKVTRIMNFGAFVEVLPGKEGLVHISRLSNERVARVEDVVHVGDELTVRVSEIDSQGRINLERVGLPARDRRPPSPRRSFYRRSPERRSDRRGGQGGGRGGRSGDRRRPHGRPDRRSDRYRKYPEEE